MSLEEFWSVLENTDVAVRIAESWWFPLIESVHVLGVAIVVGAVLMVDLRLLGVAARGYAVERFAAELVRWSWAGFAIAIVTGTGLFITRASHYASNPAFQFKVVFLLLAGVNMAIFQVTFAKNQQRFESMPRHGAIAGALSLLLWTGVVLAGRWTGHLS